MSSFVDPEFYDVFQLPFQAGYDAGSLRRSRSAVITRDEAQRLFGTTAVVGRPISIGKEVVGIVAVIDTIPEPTHFEFGLLASMDVRNALLAANGIVTPTAGDLGAWWRPDATLYTYVLRPADGSLTRDDLRASLSAFGTRHVPQVEGLSLQFGVIPVGHLAMSQLDAQFALYTGTGISATAIGYLMAALVLLIACLNYANLAAALAATRGREVGVRRVMGARRSQLMLQYLLEAAILGAAAFVLAICVLLLTTPIVARVGPNLPALFMLRREFLMFTVTVIAGMSLFAGAYPAVVLSAAQPAKVLRGGTIVNRARLMPRLLVGAQFTTVGFLLILVLISQAQNRAIFATGKALAQEPVVTFTKSIRALEVSYEPLRQRLLTAAHVRGVTASATPPLSFVSTNVGIGRAPEQGSRRTVTSRNLVSYDFFGTLGIKLVAGREFSREFADDAGAVGAPAAGRPQRIVIDEQLAERLGWSRATDAVDQIVYVPAGYGQPAQPLQIIGVVERRPLAVIGLGAASSVYLLDPSKAVFVTVRLSAADLQAGLAEIDAIWKQFAPQDSGNRTQLVDAFESAYRHLLDATTIIFVGPAVFAFLISAIGLFGTAIHATDRRKHEIGVRKTLGASTARLMLMLMADLSTPIVIGNLIAWPIAWFGANLYRSMFVDKAPLTMTPFIVSLGITLVLAWIVVAGRALRSARIHPATVLRYE